MLNALGLRRKYHDVIFGILRHNMVSRRPKCAQSVLSSNERHRYELVGFRKWFVPSVETTQKDEDVSKVCNESVLLFCRDP